MSKLNNESLADMVVDANDGVFEREPINKPGLGVEVTMSPLVTKVSIAVIGIALGAMIGKRLSVRPVVIKGAQKVQDVAEQAEEAAARG